MLRYNVKLLLLVIFVSTLPSWAQCVIDNGPVNRMLLVEGELDAIDTVGISGQFEGSIEWILEDGSSVSKGDPIARIETWQANQDLMKQRLEEQRKSTELEKQSIQDQITTLQEETEKAKDSAEVEIAELDLQLKLHARDAVQMRTKELEIEKLKQMISFYETHLAEMTTLTDKGALSQNELEDLRLKAKETQISLQRQTLELEKLIDGDALAIERARVQLRKAKRRQEANLERTQGAQSVRKKNLEFMQAELDDLRQQRMELEAGIASAVLTSPVDGTLLLDLRWTGDGMGVFEAGAKVKKQGRIGRISTSRRVKAVYNVHETDAGSIKVGQNVYTTVIPLGDTVLKGKVSSVGQVLSEVASWARDRYRIRTLKVEVELLDTVAGFKPKMSTVGHIETAVIPDALRLSLSCVTPNLKLQTQGGSFVNVVPELIGSTHIALPSDKFRVGEKYQSQIRIHPGSYQPDTPLKAQEMNIFESVSGNGEIFSAEEVPIAPAFSAKIKNLAGSGEEVKAGEVLVDLEVNELETQLQTQEVARTEREVELRSVLLETEQKYNEIKEQHSMTSMKLAIEEKRLELLNSISPSDEIKQKELAVKLAELDYKYQLSRFDTQTDLKKEGFLKATEFQQSFEQLQVTKNSLEIKKLELQLAKQPVNRLERQKLSATVSSIRTEVQNLSETIGLREKLGTLEADYARLAYELATVEVKRISSSIQMAITTASQDGVFIVQERYKGRTLEPYIPGDQAEPGYVIGKLVQMKRFRIKGKVPENAFSKLKTGQVATFSLAGRAEDKFTAKLLSVSPIPLKQTMFGNVEPVVDVVLDIDVFSPTFQPGASVVYEIQVSPAQKLPVLPMDAIYQFADKFFVYKGTDAKSIKEVKLGPRQGNNVAILEGLQASETVFVEAQP
ncbi:MAG: HlyD family efflux transporter periplasmic adaptor subunit [Candidatus Cloacimonetes bacterium]|nr:HlyD family efflux transporter periplasmic adaptor subunit [Candidatus Cloacimonadota bacterium]